MRIAQVYQQHARQVNVKKLRSDPRHEPPHLGFDGAVILQPASVLAPKKSCSKKTRKVNTKYE